MTWPAYMRIETLARYIDQPVRYVEQLEKRGLLPPRRLIGESLVFVREDVDAVIRGTHHATVADDPIAAGARRAAEAAAKRTQGPKQNRAPVLLPAAGAGQQKP